MAKVVKKLKSFEETLWDIANKLRGNIYPYKYNDVVLSLIFLKTLSDKFDASDYFNGSPMQRLQCLNRVSEFIQLTK